MANKSWLSKKKQSIKVF